MTIDAGLTTSPSRANTSDVHERLRADILGGTYPPGSKLKFAELSARYTASVSVIREVLTRLCEQRLVDSEPRIGFRVVELSSDDLEDLTATRIDVEAIAARYAVERGDMDWETDLVASHHRLANTPMLTTDEPRRISDEWESAHAAFHRAVLVGCGSPRLMAITDTLRGSAELYRRWSQTREPGRDVAAEHRCILEAALARDGDAVGAALRDHYLRTAEILLTHDTEE